MRSLLIGILTALIAAPAFAAAKRDPEKLPITRVRDLHYGDVLFYFYQGDDFEAMTRLNAYEHWGLMPHHEAQSQLLLGGLYLSLGMHNEAGARFEKLLTPDIPEGVRNRAWLYLGQIWYARGYLDRAEHALRQVSGKLPPALDAERVHYFANVLLRQGKFDEAAQLLKDWKGPADWMAYAEFNLGVAYVREGKLKEADYYLTWVGTLATTRSELLALKDRANLALGFAYLQNNQPDKARTALERVRLDGPFSNKALLGVGWADAALGNYREALTPWTELHERNLLDAAVQESFLALPYAFAKLNASAQSAEYYESAVNSFDEETLRIDQAVDRIEHGDMLAALLKEERNAHYGWFWQLKSLPEAPEARYLYTVLAGHDFQEGLKNYRDLDYLGGTLGHWGENMEAYRDMIDTRERAHAERLPHADALLATEAADRMQKTRNELEGRLKSVEAAADVAALGSPKQRQQWAEIQKLEGALAAAPDNEENAALRDRLRLVKGVLFFQLDNDFKERLWQERRTVKSLDAALREAQGRWIRLEKARQSVPTDTGAFAARIAELEQRIEAMKGRLAAMQEKQSAYLARLAVDELEKQKDRLATYRIQARYALATMYDRAANPPAGTPAAKPAPESKP